MVLRDLDPSRTVDAVYRGDPLPEDVIHETGFDNLRILPGHEKLLWDRHSSRQFGDGLHVAEICLRPDDVSRLQRDGAGAAR